MTCECGSVPTRYPDVRARSEQKTLEAHARLAIPDPSSETGLTRYSRHSRFQIDHETSTSYLLLRTRSYSWYSSMRRRGNAICRPEIGDCLTTASRLNSIANHASSHSKSILHRSLSRIAGITPLLGCAGRRDDCRTCIVHKFSPGLYQAVDPSHTDCDGRLRSIPPDG